MTGGSALSIDDQLSFAEVNRLLNSPIPVDKLSVAQLRLYLRVHGLIQKGNKADLLERVQNHYNQVHRGESSAQRGMKEHPRDSFNKACRGTICVGDKVLFQETVESEPGNPFEIRWLAAEVVEVSQKGNKYTLEVLWSEGAQPLEAMSKYVLPAKRLNELSIRRQEWTNESDRKVVLVASRKTVKKKPKPPKAVPKMQDGVAIHSKSGATKTSEATNPNSGSKPSGSMATKQSDIGRSTNPKSGSKTPRSEVSQSSIRKSSGTVQTKPSTQGKAKSGSKPSDFVPATPSIQDQSKKRKSAVQNGSGGATKQNKRARRGPQEDGPPVFSYPPGASTSTDSGLRSFNIKRVAVWSLRKDGEPCIEGCIVPVDRSKKSCESLPKKLSLQPKHRTKDKNSKPRSAVNPRRVESLSEREICRKRIACE